MEWKTDADIDDEAEQPYTSLKPGGSGGLMGRNPLPYIFMGIGLFVLIILFVFFNPKTQPESNSGDAALLQQVDSMEQRIGVMEQYIKELRDSGGQQWMDPKNSVEYQQLVNWIKSNAEVISDVAKRTESLETQIKQAKLTPAKAVAERPVASAPAVTPPKTAKPEIVKAAALPAAPKPAGSQQMTYHEVRKGETLFRIAQTYGTSVNALKEINNLKDSNIQVGQKLVVKANP